MSMMRMVMMRMMRMMMIFTNSSLFDPQLEVMEGVEV